MQQRLNFVVGYWCTQASGERRRQWMRQCCASAATNTRSCCAALFTRTWIDSSSMPTGTFLFLLPQGLRRRWCAETWARFCNGQLLNLRVYVCVCPLWLQVENQRSEEHTSELQSLMRISYAVFCLKKKKTKQDDRNI